MKFYIFLFLGIIMFESGNSQNDNVLIKNVPIANSQSDTINKPTIQQIINKPITPQPQSKKPELFNSGFIDFQNSGQMNASARVFKIYIGEPKKFMLPVSVYSGVSGNNYNTGNTVSSKGSEQMLLGLINPMSGAFNISIDNTLHYNKKSKSLTGNSID